MSSPKTIVVHDRYSALGIKRPDPKTVCKGHCEGVGFYPIPCAELARCPKPDAHKAPDWDGWHFVKCEKCNGTGLRGGRS